MGFQELEERLALAVYVKPMPLTEGDSSLASSHFAWDIAIDDQPSVATGSIGTGFGTGQDAYLSSGATQFFLADNPSFQDPVALAINNTSLSVSFGGGKLTSIGSPSTFVVSSGTFQTGQFPSLGGGNILRTGTGVYRYNLPTPYAHSVSGTVASSAGSFQFGSFWLSMNDARRVGVQNVKTPTTTTYTAPVYSESLDTNTVYYYSNTFTGTSYLEFHFFSTATGNPPADVTDLSINLDSYIASQTTNTKPQSFTVAQGQDITDRLYVDFAVPGSTVNINSPLKGSSDSADPGFIDRGPAVGFEIYASYININQSLTTDATQNWMTLGRTSGRGTALYNDFSFTAPATTSINANATVGAANYVVSLEGSPTTRASMTIGTQGKLVGTAGGTSFASSSTFDVRYADLQLLGDLRAGIHNYLVTAPDSDQQYQFTTRDPASGAHAGSIIGGTVAMTLSSPQGGTVDLSTEISTLRFSGGSANDVPYNYEVTIENAKDTNLTVDAVAASTGPISIVTQGTGTLTMAGSAIRTSGDLALKSETKLTVGSIATGNGLVTLVAPTLSLTGTVTSGGVQGTTLVGSGGSITASAVVRAGGAMKQSVRLASEQNYSLSALVAGLSSFGGGGPLAGGDRILLKNQTNPVENGIYVVPAIGAVVRASDANTSASFVSGMNVLVREGSQEGEWTFQNASATVLGTSGLIFVPTTASRVYGSVSATGGYRLGVDVATDSDIPNLTTSGPSITAINGVTLTAGMRVLVKDQNNPNENGIYVVPAGVTGTPWNRASDADSTAELQAGGYVYVRDGAQHFEAFVLDQDVPVVGSSPVNFTAFAVQQTRTNTWSPINVLDDVAVATTGNIDIATAGLLTIDGVALQAGQRVLVKSQIDPTQNGVYIASAGGWSRATSDMGPGSLFARTSSVYVLYGTQNAGTAWQFNDVSLFRGTVTAGSPLITGVIANTSLSVDMLVTGTGIPAGTKIQQINTDGSIRLSANALIDATGTFTFMKVSSVTVDVDPIVFIPVGGELAVSATDSIGGSGRLQAATTLLTAGSAGVTTSGSIDSLMNVGRVSATAPSSIKLRNSTPLELDLVKTTTAGSIDISAAGALTVLSVYAAAATTPQPVTLSSTVGDVVVESIEATRGDISVTSSSGRIDFTKARRDAANVTAIAGGVYATANASGAVIKVDGRVLAKGDGSDVVLASNLGSLLVTTSAIITADDQLSIKTPNSLPNLPSVGSGAAITAARLGLTSWFGTPPSDLLSKLGTYQVVDLNRTDPGAIDLAFPASLTVEGATTANGYISLSAPDITVSGPIAAIGTGVDVTLVASTGNLLINGTVKAPQDVTLSATAGEIGGSITQSSTASFTAGSAVVSNLTSTSGLAVGMRVSGTGIPGISSDLPAGACIVSIDSATQVTLSVPASASGTGVSLTFTSPTALVTATRNVTANASSAARLAVKAAGLTNTVISAANAFLGVTDTDGLDLTQVSFTDNGTAAFNITSAALGGTTNIGTVDAGATGTIVVTSYGNILGITPDTTADIRAAGATLLTTAGRIRIDTDLDSLTATAIQKNQSITINDIGDLQLRSVGSGSSSIGVDVDVTAAGSITATKVLTAGKVTLKATAANADILVDSVTAAGNQAILQAGNSIKEVTTGDAGADITATSVSLTATNSDINVYLATSAATVAGNDVKIKNDTALSVGASTATTMQLDVGGVVTQAANTAIVAGTLVVNAYNGSSITLDKANQVAAFAATSVAGAVRGGVTFNDSSSDLVLGTTATGLSGGAVKVTAAGNVSQSSPTSAANAIDATSLTIQTTAGSSVTLDNPYNRIGSLRSANGGVLTVSSAGGFDASGITGTVVTINANGDVTQLAGPTNAITATTSLTVNNKSTGVVRLDNAANNTPSLSIDNETRDVTYKNAAAIAVATAGITGGAIALTSVGGLTETGTIRGTSLSVTNTGGNVVLDNANNKVGSLAVANTLGTVTYKNAEALAIAAAGIQGTSIDLTAVGGLTDIGAITGTSLSVTNTGNDVVLDNANNKVGSLAVANSLGTVTYKNAEALAIAAAGIQGTAIDLTAVGGLNDIGAITGTSLSVTNTGSGVILLDTATSSVGSLVAVNTGRNISYTNAGAVALGVIDGAAVGITVVGSGDVSQAAGKSIKATTLDVVSAAGNIVLTSVTNNVGTFTATSNPTGVSGTGNIDFTNAGGFKAGPITAGAALSGNGFISLTAKIGTLQVVGDLTALNDSVSVNAPAGNITFGAVSINADVLSYQTAAGQTPSLPAVVPPIIVSNGNLTLLNPDPSNTVLVNGYPLVSGDITITSNNNQPFEIKGPLSAGGNITITSNTGFQVSEKLTAGAGKAVTLSAATGAIGFAGAGGIFYTTTNGTTTLSAAAGTITDAAATVISGATTSITIGQNLTQLGQINSGTLTVMANNAANAVLGGGNDVGTFVASSVSGGNRGNITLNDTTTGLGLGAITGGSVKVTGVGSITQSGVIDATTLDITGTGGAISLNTQNNAIGAFKAANTGGPITLKDTSSGLDLGAVSGTVVTINGVGGITQSGVITATTLDVTGNGGAIALNTQNNAIGVFKAVNTGGPVSLKDTTAGLDLGVITGTVVTINGVGAMTQSGILNAGTLDVTGDGSAITFNTENNTIGTFKAANSAGAVSLKDTSTGLALGAVTGTVVTINGVGAISQSGVIDATTLDITGNGGAITLNSPNNTIGTLAVANGIGAVTVLDTAGGLSLGNITSGTLIVTASNTGGAGVTVNQTRVVVSGNITITTDGGLTVEGTQPATNPPSGLLTGTATNSVINLQNVAGVISLVSGGAIIAPTVNYGNNRIIQVGGVVTSASDLVQAVNTVNSLSPISGSTYEIVIGQSFILTSELPAVTRPITLRGNDPANLWTISSGGSSKNGLVLSSNASGSARGSTVRDIAFSGFSGNGILVNGGTSTKPMNVKISNVSISNSGTTGAGLNFAGTGAASFFTGSTVQSCTFTNSPYALRLASAQGVTFGGSAAGQANTINGSSKAGIFASGFCTNSSLIKTIFKNTKTPYNTSTSRNLKIVK